MCHCSMLDVLHPVEMLGFACSGAGHRVVCRKRRWRSGVEFNSLRSLRVCNTSCALQAATISASQDERALVGCCIDPHERDAECHITTQLVVEFRVAQSASDKAYVCGSPARNRESTRPLHGHGCILALAQLQPAKSAKVGRCIALESMPTAKATSGRVPCASSPRASGVQLLLGWGRRRLFQTKRQLLILARLGSSGVLRASLGGRCAGTPSGKYFRRHNLPMYTGRDRA